MRRYSAMGFTLITPKRRGSDGKTITRSGGGVASKSPLRVGVTCIKLFSFFFSSFLFLSYDPIARRSIASCARRMNARQLEIAPRSRLSGGGWRHPRINIRRSSPPPPSPALDATQRIIAIISQVMPVCTTRYELDTFYARGNTERKRQGDLGETRDTVRETALFCDSLSVVVGDVFTRNLDDDDRSR